MTENQQKFVDLAKYSEELAAKKLEVDEQLRVVMGELGLDTFVQDPETLTVYKIVKPKGTFTYFKEVDYIRTALEGERAGTLSKKAAEEAGFVVKK